MKKKAPRSRRGTGVYGPTLMQNGGVILNFFFNEKCAEGKPPAHVTDIYLQNKEEIIQHISRRYIQ